MEGASQRSLQLLVVNGYCVFEDDDHVDGSGIQDGRPNYANITFSGLFARPSVGRPEVIDKGPDHAASFLLGFYARAGCPPM